MVENSYTIKACERYIEKLILPKLLTILTIRLVGLLICSQIFSLFITAKYKKVNASAANVGQKTNEYVKSPKNNTIVINKHNMNAPMSILFL